MKSVTKDEFFAKLMTETRDVVSSCERQGTGHYVSTFEYRYPHTPFGLIETDYSQYPAIEVCKLA
jgi:hypothetical protein